MAQAKSAGKPAAKPSPAKAGKKPALKAAPKKKQFGTSLRVGLPIGQKNHLL